MYYIYRSSVTGKYTSPPYSNAYQIYTEINPWYISIPVKPEHVLKLKAIGGNPFVAVISKHIIKKDQYYEKMYILLKIK